MVFPKGLFSYEDISNHYKLWFSLITWFYNTRVNGDVPKIDKKLIFFLLIEIFDKKRASLLKRILSEKVLYQRSNIIINNSRRNWILKIF